MDGGRVPSFIDRALAWALPRYAPDPVAMRAAAFQTACQQAWAEVVRSFESKARRRFGREGSSRRQGFAWWFGHSRHCHGECF